MSRLSIIREFFGVEKLEDVYSLERIPYFNWGGSGKTDIEEALKLTKKGRALWQELVVSAYFLNCGPMSKEGLRKQIRKVFKANNWSKGPKRVERVILLISKSAGLYKIPEQEREVKLQEVEFWGDVVDMLKEQGWEPKSPRLTLTRGRSCPCAILRRARPGQAEALAEFIPSMKCFKNLADRPVFDKETLRDVLVAAGIDPDAAMAECKIAYPKARVGHRGEIVFRLKKEG